MKIHHRYSFRYLLFFSIIFILPLLLTACSSNAASEMKITTRDQAAEMDKELGRTARRLDRASRPAG